MDSLRGRLERLRDGLPSQTAAVTLSRTDLEELLGAADEVDPIGDLTVQELATELGRAPSTVRTWAASGALQGYKFRGREWRFTRESVRAFLERGGELEPDELDGGGDLGSWRRAG